MEVKENVYHLPMGWDINYSARKCLPLADGVGYKLFGSKMLCSHGFTVGVLFFGGFMKIKQGYSYHIKQEFFDIVHDKYLMSNKENRKYRPHYYAIKDNSHSNFYWMIPISSKIEKYETIIKKKTEKYGYCNTIFLGTFAKSPAVYLLQNAFPIVDKYIDHVHTIDGIAVEVTDFTNKRLVSMLNNLISLRRKGVNLFFPDIDKIYLILAKS